MIQCGCRVLLFIFFTPHYNLKTGFENKIKEGKLYSNQLNTKKNNSYSISNRENKLFKIVYIEPIVAAQRHHRKSKATKLVWPTFFVL